MTKEELDVKLAKFMEVKKKDREQNWAIYYDDLTAKAERGELDPIIGRDTELATTVQVLSMRRKNNPLLVGEPGVGKTAIAEGVAQLVVDGRVPRVLHGCRVLAISLVSVVAGTRYRGEFEERLEGLLKHLKGMHAILFIDEFHTIVGAGGREGSLDAANIMKPALARGELRCIGATTKEEYEKYVKSDMALERRFRVVGIEEPTVQDSVRILEGIKGQYEKHHGLSIDKEAIIAAVELTHERMPNRRLPDKAIDIIDESCARMNMVGGVTSVTRADVENLLQECQA